MATPRKAPLLGADNAALVHRIQSLTGGIDIDLDAPLPADDE